MQRRMLVTGAASGAVAWPFASGAQQIRRVAMLIGGNAADSEQVTRLAAFRDALHSAGWREDRNLTIDLRYTSGEAGELRERARELVDRKPDVILAATTQVVAALLGQTRTIPIIFVNVSDPIGSGFVNSLSRPGGSVTGFINIEASLGEKWLELLHEIAPRVRRVAIMFNPETAPQSTYYLPTFERSARILGVESSVARIRNVADIESVIAAQGRQPDGGLIAMPDFYLTPLRSQIIALAARHRVPAVFPFRFFAADGGLASYGVDLVELYRQAASYVDRVLRGARPAELPVQQPSKFELVINLGTAKALGLDIPLGLLARADEVIE